MTFDEFCEELFPNGWENFDDNLQLYDLRRAYNAGVNSVTDAAAQSELGTLCFHIEQAIENKCCSYEIESAYEAYVAAIRK